MRVAHNFHRLLAQLASDFIRPQMASVDRETAARSHIRSICKNKDPGEDRGSK